MRKRKATCCRCGREFEEGETYDKVWTGHGMALVCHDDKTCEERLFRWHKKRLPEKTEK